MAGAKGREGGRQVCVRALLIFLSDGDTLHWGDVEGGNERGASERALSPNSSRQMAKNGQMGLSSPLSGGPPA